MIRIGRLLKEAREKKGLTLEQVSAKTKIHVHKLVAIEEGDQAELPAKVFAVGLIKSYARELKVDMAAIDQLCQEVYAEEIPLVKPEVTTTQASDEPVDSQPVGRFQVPKTISIIFSIGIIAALFFVIYLVIEKMNAYSEEATIPPSEISQPTEPTEPVVTSTPAIPTTAPTSADDKDKKVESTPVATVPADVAAPKAEEPKTAAPTTTAPEAAKKPTPAPEVAPQAPAERKADTIVATPASKVATPPQDDLPVENEEKAPGATASSNNKLSILAHEPVRIEILWSDGYVQTILLKSQESKTFVFSSRIVVRINNGGAVKVSHNDAEAKVPGTFNQPIELKYP